MGFEGKGVGVERAVLKSVNGAIPAGFFRFKPDEPGHGANRARSVFVQLKHAVIQSRIEKGQSAGDRDDVSCETIVILFCFS